MDLVPDAIARYLSPEELKLYRLVWNRFVASQMSPSLSEITTADFEARRPDSADLAIVRATGTVLKDLGWLRVYEKVADEAEEEAPAEGEDGDAAKVRLPALAEGDAVAVVEATAEGHETQPPPRFNEASLVKFLEENGIGRPSTYAEILRKIEDREYVRKKDRRFTPTPLGRIIVDLMREGFDDFFQTEYTAKMEEELDEVEEGKLDWRKALAEFDGKFVKDREKAKKKMVSLKAGLPLKDVRTHFIDFKLTNDPGDICPKSGHLLKLRMGKAGLFIACSGYPDCDFTQDIPEVEEDPIDATELEGQTCEECGSPMKLRTGRNGSAFLGCTAYPVCRNTVPVKVAGGKAEAKPDVPTGESARTAATTSSRAQALRGLRGLSTIRVPVQAAQARHAPGSEMPGLQDGRHPRAPGPVRSLLRLLERSDLREELQGAARPEGLPELQGAVPPREGPEGRPVLRLRDRGLRPGRRGGRPRRVRAHDAYPRGRARGGHRRGAHAGAGQGREEAGAAGEGDGEGATRVAGWSSAEYRTFTEEAFRPRRA